MTIQLDAPVLRMTKPSIVLPPPLQKRSDERSNAMYELETNVVHRKSLAAFRDREMPLELISSISDFLKLFSDPDDHSFFIQIANNPDRNPTDHTKIWNLLNLTPHSLLNSQETDVRLTMRAALSLMNGLNIWGFPTDSSLVEGSRAAQAQALLYVTARVRYACDTSPTIMHNVSYPLLMNEFLSDPEFADLIMEYPQHQRLIAETVVSRESIDAEVIRPLILEGARVINEGML